MCNCVFYNSSCSQRDNVSESHSSKHTYNVSTNREIDMALKRRRPADISILHVSLVLSLSLSLVLSLVTYLLHSLFSFDTLFDFAYIEMSMHISFYCMYSTDSFYYSTDERHIS